MTGSIVADGTLFDAAARRPRLDGGRPRRGVRAAVGDHADGNASAAWRRPTRAARRTRCSAARCARAGVRVAGGFRVGRSAGGARAVVGVDARRARPMLRAMGKNSDNFTAEMLLEGRRRERYYGHAARRGSAPAARAPALRDLGVDLTRLAHRRRLRACRAATASRPACSPGCSQRADRDAARSAASLRALARDRRPSTARSSTA